MKRTRDVSAGRDTLNNFRAGLSSGNAERTAARLRTLGLILPTTAPLIRTDLPPALILITHPNGLLGGEPRERSHAWWETNTPLDELIRAENIRKMRLPMVVCRPEDEPRIRAMLADGGLSDKVSLSPANPLLVEFVPEGQVLFYDPRPFLDEPLPVFVNPPRPRLYWAPPLSPRNIASITGVC